MWVTFCKNRNTSFCHIWTSSISCVNFEKWASLNILADMAGDTLSGTQYGTPRAEPEQASDGYSAQTSYAQQKAISVS